MLNRSSSPRSEAHGKEQDLQKEGAGNSKGTLESGSDCIQNRKTPQLQKKNNAPGVDSATHALHRFFVAIKARLGDPHYTVWRRLEV